MSQQEITRKPRMWLVAWIYKYDVETIVKRLEDMKEQFESELLEIYSSPSIRGYVFLRVTHPCLDLIDALKGVSGIGGVENFERKNPLDFVSHPLHFQNVASDLDCGDLIIVKIGPLRDHIGRIAALEATGKHVEVELNIFGKMITTKFNRDEIQSVSKEN